MLMSLKFREKQEFWTKFSFFGGKFRPQKVWGLSKEVIRENIDVPTISTKFRRLPTVFIEIQW